LIDPPQIDEELMFGLVTHMNPTVVYLCQEIEKTDQAIRSFQDRSHKALQNLTTEYMNLKKEQSKLLEIK
jgi:hypothetical protein